MGGYTTMHGMWREERRGEKGRPHHHQPLSIVASLEEFRIIDRNLTQTNKWHCARTTKAQQQRRPCRDGERREREGKNRRHAQRPHHRVVTPPATTHVVVGREPPDLSRAAHADRTMWLDFYVMMMVVILLFFLLLFFVVSDFQPYIPIPHILRILSQWNRSLPWLVLWLVCGGCPHRRRAENPSNSIDFISRVRLKKESTQPRRLGSACTKRRFH